MPRKTQQNSKVYHIQIQEQLKTILPEKNSFISQTRKALPDPASEVWHGEIINAPFINVKFYPYHINNCS